ncbi:MAG: hypothetical protein IT307_19065 [Chloroflexi bacterium]|nr:hypothetical protein [Chloroflexota bacterium]
MRETIRRFLLLEGAIFALASLLHRGVPIGGYRHTQAAIAESVIAGVLLGGLALTWAWPAQARPIGMAAQGFVLLGTLVGISMAAIGVGPRTVPDVTYHLAILTALV